MDETFNPYRQWLGIQSGQRPADHYELLGIARFEGDAAVIAQAADRLIARIRSIRPGPHLAEWQRLLDAVAGAKTCLLDPTVKPAYDASLRRKTPPNSAEVPTAQAAPDSTPFPEAPPAQRPTPGATPPFVHSPGAPLPVANAVVPRGDASFPQDVAVRQPMSTRAGSRRSRSRGPSGAQLAVYGLTAVFLVLAGVLGYLIYQQRSVATPGDRGISEADSRMPTAAQDAPGQNARRKPADRLTPTSPPSGEAKQPEGDPAPIPPNSQEPSRPSVKEGGPTAPGSVTPSDPTTSQEKGPGGEAGPEHPADPTPQPGEKPALKSEPGAKLDAERQQALSGTLADARFSMSEHDLAGARRHLEAAAEQAKTPEELAEVDRLDTLAGHLEEFWKGMSRIVAGLEPAEALPVGDTFVGVVEASPEEVTVKVEGQIRTYKIDHMPSALVQALADARLADDPATNVLLGSYLLVDPDGDPARTRQLWTEALQQGVDVKGLLPELDKWKNTTRATGRTAGGRAAPPADAQKLQAAAAAIGERFKAEYAAATSAAGRSRLASALLEAGRRAADNPEERFVLLAEARDQGVAAGEPELACQAIDQLASSFHVDALGMKAAALTEASKTARRSSAQAAITQIALPLVSRAVEAKRIDEATRLAETALAAARKSNSRTLMQQAVLVVQEVQALPQQSQSTGNPQAAPD